MAPIDFILSKSQESEKFEPPTKVFGDILVFEKTYFMSQENSTLHSKIRFPELFETAPSIGCRVKAGTY